MSVHVTKERQTKWRRSPFVRPITFFLSDFPRGRPIPADEEVVVQQVDFSTQFSTCRKVGGALREGRQGQQPPTATTTTTISAIPADNIFIFIFIDDDKMITNTTSPEEVLGRPKQKKGERESKYRWDMRNNSLE